MDDDEETKSSKFVGISDKLNAPKKVSQFEKARLEAENKRQREEAEAQRALREFEDSFAEGEEDGWVFGGDNDDRAPWDSSGPRESDRPRGGSRGFPSQYGADSGPPPSMKRKREMEQADMRRRGRDHERTPPFGRSHGDRRDNRGVFAGMDDEDEDDSMGRLSKRRSPDPKVRKPTVLLQCLPRSTTEADIRDLLSKALNVEDVTFVDSARERTEDKRTKSALVAVAAATPVSEVDKVVSQIQNKYLGYGCYLKISRHVSALGNLSKVDTSILSVTNRNPFGASQVTDDDQQLPALSYNRAAPPSSFGSSGPGQSRRPSGFLQVNVTPPSDIKLLKLINQTAERLVNYGADFEALLMANPEVQRDEKWAWLFDSSSPGGVYYRWLIWKAISTGTDANSGPPSLSQTPGSDRIFDSGPIWIPPTDVLKYSNATRLEDLCEHDDYASSEEDSGDENEQRRGKDGNTSAQLMSIEDVGNSAFDAQSHYLNPYRRAKLTHLLARLPDSIATLRSGDIARVTHFVVKHAGQGAEEIVDMLICNVEHPFRYAVRYDDKPTAPSEPEDSDGDQPEAADAGKKRDRSASQLIALYAISDVLLTSATSGVRDAWKYRTLFEAALVSRGVFERLGRLEKDHGWGRMKAEQWKRKIMVVLDLWNSASVFPTDVWRGMKRNFLEPPLSREEREQKEVEERREREERERGKWKAAGTGGDDGSRTGSGVGEEAAKKVEPPDDAKAEAMRKIAAMKAKLAASKPPAKEADQRPAEANAEQQPPQQGSRRSRPTAEDLFDAPEEPAPAPPPAPEPAKTVPAGPVSFSLGGLSGAGQAAPVDVGKPKGAFGGFSMGAKSIGAKPEIATGAKGGVAKNMFGDDSDED